MILQSDKAYIQLNPLFGRKVLLIDRLRPSVWDWDLLDLTVVTIDRDPTIVHPKGIASVVYDHQGLQEIPVRMFRKVEGLVKLYEASARVLDDQACSVLRQETLGKVVALLTDHGILTDATYSPAQMQAFAAQYDQYSRQQMQHVTDVIDVHK